MKIAAAFLVLALGACASAPPMTCIPPDIAPQTTGSSGRMAGGDSAAQDEYVRCKEREAEERLDQQLREDQAKAKQREAEQLERELREAQGEPPAEQPD